MAQGLAYAVHLIVVPAVWKREKLIFEISKPWSLLREEHLTVLELGGLDGHADFLVILRLDGNDREIRLEAPSRLRHLQSGSGRAYAALRAPIPSFSSSGSRTGRVAHQSGSICFREPAMWCTPNNRFPRPACWLHPTTEFFVQTAAADRNSGPRCA